MRAASQVILSQGTEGLTLDAVAREAGISKGGLLYHFPNKEALIIGIIQQIKEIFDTVIVQEFERDDTPNTPGRWVRAMVRTSFTMKDQHLAPNSGLLAAVSVNPELLEPIKANYRKWQEKFDEDGLDPEILMLIRLATDGLIFTEILGLDPPEEPLRTKVLEALLALTRSHP